MIAYLIPTLNERESIAPLIDSILNLSSHDSVFVVDDSSEDGTAEHCKNTYKNEPRVNILTNPNRKGLGSSLKYGMVEILKLNPDGIITMDADGSHDPAVSIEMINVNEPDLVIGSRYRKDSIHGLPPIRFWLSKLGNMLSIKLLGTDISDTTSGYRYYKGAKLKELNFHSIVSNDYNFQIEVLHHLLAAQAKVVEVPIKFKPRIYGRSKFSFKQVILSSLLLIKLFKRNLRT